MTNEYEELKKALRQADTPEARKAAAEAMRRYSEAQKRAGKQSRPMLVSLGIKKGYRSAIPLDELPEEMEASPELYELMGKIVK